MRKRYSISLFQMLIEFCSIISEFFYVSSKNVCAIGLKTYTALKYEKFSISAWKIPVYL
jgi:hypothetical protein